MLCKTLAMFVRLSGPGADPELVDPLNCQQFHVEYGVVGARPTEVASALGTWAAGATDAHVWVRVEAVRVAASAVSLPDSWDGEFSGMLGYARSKGWLNAQGDAIAAHVEASGDISR